MSRVRGDGVPDSPKVPSSTDGGGGPARRRGGVTVSTVLPGLPQILAGRWGVGGTALLSWVLAVGALVLGWDRISAPGSYGVDEAVALVALVVSLTGSWIWSFRDVRSDATSRHASSWEPTIRAFSRNRLAVLGVFGIVAACLLAVLAPFVAPYDPTALGDLLTERFAAPSAAHPLGTDHIARDVLSRLLFGARVSLSIAVIAVVVSLSLGTVLGAVAGYAGGVVDSIVMRLVDVVLAFPRLVLLICIAAFFDASLYLIVTVLALTQWPGITRMVRGEVVSLREREFVHAARALGFSRGRVLFRHILPNALATIIVAGTLGIGNTIILEAGLSFLGLGVPSPTPSWGGMIADGRGEILLDAWWLSTFAGLAIVFTVLAFNVVGDGLRDAFDPRMRARAP